MIWKNIVCIAGQDTDDSMAHAYYRLDDKDCKHTIRICNIHCFSTATMVEKTRLSDTFIRALLSRGRLYFMISTLVFNYESNY
jgi:hypothetical protein